MKRWYVVIIAIRLLWLCHKPIVGINIWLWWRSVNVTRTKSSCEKRKVNTRLRVFSKYFGFLAQGTVTG